MALVLRKSEVGSAWQAGRGQRVSVRERGGEWGAAAVGRQAGTKSEGE